MTEQCFRLCTCFPLMFRLLQSQFKLKSKHDANCYVCWGKIAHNTDHYSSTFQFTVLSAVGWFSIFACVAGEFCRNACPWSKDSHKTVLLRVGLACTQFSCPHLPWYSGIVGRDVLSRLSCVFGLPCDFRFSIMLSYFVVRQYCSTRKTCIIPQRGIKWI